MPSETPPHRRDLITCLAAVVAAAAVYVLLPEQVGEPGRRAAGIFVIAAVLWATQAIPLFATSLCVIGLEILLLARQGGLSPVGDLSYEQFLEPFSSSIIILFMGGFLLSAAVTKHRVDRVIASWILRPFVKQPIMLIFGILLITSFFSMWISNTAATAMMLAIVAPVLRQIPPGDRFERAVILAVAFGANIGGIGTPIGTPPNAVALAALHQAGYRIGFLDWMLVAVPLAGLLILIVGGLLYWLFPCRSHLKLDGIDKPEPLDRRGRTTVLIMALAITLWLTGEWHGVRASVVALIAAAFLTAFRILDRDDVDRIDWNILILMWGGLSLGQAVTLTGLVDVVNQLPIADMHGFLLSAVIVGLSVGLSTVMSNTATANLIVPIAMTFGPHERVSLVILTALSCSFAMAMPVSTPPNAIVFASGRIPVSSMIRAGGLIGLISVVVLLLGYRFILPLFLLVIE